jgi:hypothetical protein
MVEEDGKGNVRENDPLFGGSGNAEHVQHYDIASVHVMLQELAIITHQSIY